MRTREKENGPGALGGRVVEDEGRKRLGKEEESGRWRGGGDNTGRLRKKKDQARPGRTELSE